MGRPKVAVVAKRRLKALNAAKIDTASLDSRLLAMFSDVISTKCHCRRPTANPKEIQTLEIPRFNQDLRLGANLAQEALNLRDIPFQASGILSLDLRVCCASGERPPDQGLFFLFAPQVLQLYKCWLTASPDRHNSYQYLPDPSHHPPAASPSLEQHTCEPTPCFGL